MQKDMLAWTSGVDFIVSGRRFPNDCSNSRTPSSRSARMSCLDPVNDALYTVRQYCVVHSCVLLFEVSKWREPNHEALRPPRYASLHNLRRPDLVCMNPNSIHATQRRSSRAWKTRLLTNWPVRRSERTSTGESIILQSRIPSSKFRAEKWQSCVPTEQNCRLP